MVECLAVQPYTISEKFFASNTLHCTQNIAQNLIPECHDVCVKFSQLTRLFQVRLYNYTSEISRLLLRFRHYSLSHAFQHLSQLQIHSEAV